jgi:hypothetical protein
MKITKSQLKQIIREEVDVTLGEPIPAEGLADAIAQDISDMYKEMNGIRPRWYEFSKMPLEELEDLHGKTVKDLQNYYAEEEHQDRQAWRDDDPESIARGKEIEAEYEAEKGLAAAAAEEERMKTPEQGEEFPKRAGIKRRIKEQELKEIVKEEIEVTLNLRQESIDDVTPETIAQFAWEENIRLQDFGEPNKEPRLTRADEKRIAQIVADEAEVEIDAWGDAVESYNFKNFVDKVVSALWHIHKKAEEGSLEEDKDWIQKAVNPEHEGDCTPMTKSTCTPKRKALAKRFKKAAKKKETKGGTGWQGKV